VGVSSEELTVAFPRDTAADTSWDGGQVSDRFAGPEWRVMIRVDTTFLAAVHKVYPDTSLALPPYGSLSEVVRAGKLQNCHLQDWILVCGERLDGSVELLGDRVVLRIRSHAWINRLREARPKHASISQYKLDRRYAYGDSVVIDYLPQ
jgi:hypothetical protein